MLTLVLGGALIFLIFEIIRFLHKVWWNPIRIQHIMALQGVKGPPYSFFHGNTKQIQKMVDRSLSSSMDLSHNIFPRIAPHIHECIQLYGRNYLNWHGPQAQLIVTELELVKEILSNRYRVCSKVTRDRYTKKLIGDGILVSEGVKWAKLRKISNHAFHGESLKGMVPEVIASAEEMLERWKVHEGKEIEIYEEFRIFTSEVISRTAFGSSYLEGRSIFEKIRKLGVIISRNTLKIHFPGMGKLVKSHDDIESDKIEQDISDIITSMIKKREDKVHKGEAESYGSDFLGSLIKAYHSTDENMRISINTVVSECKNFYLAGQETTSSLLAWTILLLAMHMDWQDKARNEVLQIFGQEKPTPEGFARLKTMSMILNETQRLYGPVINLFRRVEKEVKLRTLTLPTGMDLSISILALHHDPEIWGQDTHLFKPERFSEGVAKATNNNITSFIPFGFGPRMCVGMNLATTEAKIALSMILQRYKFTVSPNYVHAPLHILTVQPKSGIQIIIHAI